MDLITCDFETFYDTDYTLSKLTTEAYIRDPRFETILCGFQINDRPGYWVDGCDVAKELERVRMHENSVLAHHAHFDGLILSHHYGVYPKVWFDTLSMSRAVLGGKGGLSLAKLAQRFGLGTKGEEVIIAKGMRRRDFDPRFLAKYGGYCINDCDLEYRLFQKLLPYFGRGELKVVDMVIRMFTEPRLALNKDILEKSLQDIKLDKTTALLRAGIQLSDVMSDDKFAAALETLGVLPPTKLNAKGIEKYAFAKTDPAMEALADHPDDDVQALVAARLKNKTTIAESRTARMIGMADRGAAPVYLKYYGADQTGRHSGGDKMNWQNFGRGSQIRNAIEAWSGQELCVADSSNIEARVLDWLAMQEDAVEVYRKNDAGLGPDVYCVLACRIYGREIVKGRDIPERQMGKTAKLGLGYGMGYVKFASAARVQVRRKIELSESQLIVDTYRTTHKQVLKLWKRCENALEHIRAGTIGVNVDIRGVVKTCEGGLLLPNGMVIKYPDLTKGATYEEGWTYWNGRSREKIYGAKVVENIVQALARIIVIDQTLEIDRYLPVVMSVHDEAVAPTDADDAEDATQFMLEAFRKPPEWGTDLPLNSEGGHNLSYGKAKH
jgi:DNA polymerase